MAFGVSVGLLFTAALGVDDDEDGDVAVSIVQ